MKVGLIDVDGHNFPNIPFMKLSAWHKKKGDSVEWYYPLISGEMDVVYLSKVFGFTDDYQYYINSKKVIKGGSGYCIKNVDGKEIYMKENDIQLPYEIEHIYPDYSLYRNLTKDTAYGFLTRGCPRNCSFCHVGSKEGSKSYKVADLSEFWNGQSNIVLLDPNITACKEYTELFDQLIKSNAYVDFSQGIDIRTMTEEKSELIKQIKIKSIHFAWDRYEDKEKIIPKLKMLKKITEWDKRKMIVYVLTNYDTTIEQDLERIYTIRDLGFWPYVMIYDRVNTRSKDTVRKLQRWVNMRAVFEKVKRFEDYQK